MCRSSMVRASTTIHILEMLWIALGPALLVLCRDGPFWRSLRKAVNPERSLRPVVRVRFLLAQFARCLDEHFGEPGRRILREHPIEGADDMTLFFKPPMLHPKGQNRSNRLVHPGWLAPYRSSNTNRGSLWNRPEPAVGVSNALPACAPEIAECVPVDGVDDGN